MGKLESPHEWCHRIRHPSVRQRLTEHGFAEERAEAPANGQVTLPDGSLAARADGATLEADLRKRRFGAMIAQGGPIVALVELS